jgi:hypothetical protein
MFDKAKGGNLDKLKKALHEKNQAIVDTWKYGSSHGVDSLPFGFVDGQRLKVVPLEFGSWVDLLGTIAQNKGLVGKV